MSKTFDQFRRDNVTTTFPSALEYGKEVYYKDPNGVLTLCVGDENGAGQPVAGGAYPSRVVNVFGTADNVAPNFNTVAGAITYANSLTPPPDPASHPVVIRLFTDSDGFPYTLAGLDPWITYADNGIYFESDFVRVNTSTTLPTSIAPGKTVWYIDPNGVETLWVGREDGSAWPACGYKDLIIRVLGFYVDATAVLLKNDIGVTSSSFSETSWRFFVTNDLSLNRIELINSSCVYADSNNTGNFVPLANATYQSDTGGGGPRISVLADATIEPLAPITLNIRIYP